MFTRKCRSIQQLTLLIGLFASWIILCINCLQSVTNGGPRLLFDLPTPYSQISFGQWKWDENRRVTRQLTATFWQAPTVKGWHGFHEYTTLGLVGWAKFWYLWWENVTIYENLGLHLTIYRHLQFTLNSSHIFFVKRYRFKSIVMFSITAKKKILGIT